jgi:hypothetical protein
VIPSRILLCQCQCGYEEGGPVWRVPRGGRREVSAPLTHSLTHSLTTLITIPYILSFITSFTTQPITSLTHSHSSLCNDSTLKLSSPHYSTHSLTHLPLHSRSGRSLDKPLHFHLTQPQKDIVKCKYCCLTHLPLHSLTHSCSHANEFFRRMLVCMCVCVCVCVSTLSSRGQRFLFHRRRSVSLW